MALGAGEVLLAMAVVRRHCAMAARAGQGLCARGARRMRLVAGDAGTERSLLRGMIGVGGLVAAAAGVVCALPDVVRVVATRAGAMRCDLSGSERLVAAVTAFTRRRRGRPEVVGAVAAVAGLVTALERGCAGDDGVLAAVAAQALVADSGSRAVRLVAVQALLVDGAMVARALAVVQ